MHAVRSGGATPPRGLLALGIALIALLALAPASLASTVTGGEVITFTAAPAVNNDTEFFQEDPADETEEPAVLVIETFEDPVTGTLPENCEGTDDGGLPTDFEIVRCAGVLGLIDNAGDGDDSQDAGDLETIAVTHNGATGSDELVAGGANDTLNGGDQDDALYGLGGADTIDGGDGDDFLVGDFENFCCFPDTVGARGFSAPGGTDTLRGQNGDDTLFGGGANDTLSGGADDDGVFGGGNDDLLNGDEGNDALAGDGGSLDGGTAGSDTTNGGTGDDDVSEFDDEYRDTVSGGDGIDSLFYESCADENDTVGITLDDQANDGETDDPGNNFRADLDNVDVDNDCDDGTPAFIRGHNGVNALSGDNGADDIDGLAGVDFIRAESGNDTVGAVDGFPDVVNCGPGTDTANVDQFDTVSECETVNRTNVRSAFADGGGDDRPPNVSFTSPTSGARLGTTSPSRLTLDANDDRGVSQVIVLDDERPVCVDATAPYTCDYTPRGEDVGRNTLVGVAVDSSGQTANALRAVTVARFTPRQITASTTPRRDAARPFRFRTTGRVVLPSGVRAADGCKGTVSVTVKAGTRTISTRRANVRNNCTYSSRVTFTDTRRFRGRRSLTFQTRFNGNEVLLPRRSGRTTRRVR